MAGEALADVPSLLLRQREVPGLEDARLQVLGARIDADLALGRHGEVVAELRQLVAAHPLWEHFAAQLMLGLYRSGRQGDALAAYQDVRRVLAAELGVDPGPELRLLQRQILAADPALIPTGNGATAAGVAAAPGPTAAPGQLPASLDAQAGLYRSLLAGRRMLVLLDNARDAGQVRPLLPASPGCLVLVTSRNQLTGLAAAEGAMPLALDLLTGGEAEELLAARLGGDRLASDPPPRRS